MADFLSNVLASNVPALPTGDPSLVRLNLDSAASTALKPFAGQGMVALTVKQLLPGDLAVLALPNGQTITAQAPRTPLQLGSQLLVQLPSSFNGASAAQLTNTQVQLLARLSTPVTRGGTVPTGSLPLPGTMLGGGATAAPLPLVNLQAVLSRNPVLAVAEEILAAVANAATPEAATVPTQLPAGPVVVTPQTTAPAPLPPGPAVVQVTQPPVTPGSPQQAMLFPIPAANTPTPAPLPIQINAGQALPPGTEFTLTIPTPTATAPPAAAPVVVQLPTALPLAPQPLIGAQVASAQTPEVMRPATPTTLNPVAPVQATPAVVQVTLSQNTPLPAAPQLARVMTPATPVQNQPGTFTQQVVLATGQTATVTTPAPLPPGTSLLLQPNLTQPLQPQVVQINLPQTPAAPMPPPASPASVPANIPVNQPLTAQVQMSAANTPPQTLQLTITSPEGQGQTLTVSSPSPLPPGTVLGIRVNADAQVVVESLTPPPALAGQQTLAQFQNQWPQLARAVAQLNATDPARAAELTSRLPQAAGLMPGLASYADALTHQAADKWLGNPVVSMLRAMGVDLTHDLSQLAVFRQPTPDGWQGMIFPYMEQPQGNPRQGRFFWKNSQGDEQRNSGNTRFVVEMNLSSMGEVQLDGLLTYPELWLKLRLHPGYDTSFAPGLQNAVQSVLEGFGLSGGLSVETSSVFPIDAARLVPKPAAPTVAAEL
jgi:hypothetical protein